MPSAPRADAIRSRARILDAARACDPTVLRLNDVARSAGVGVGTVYRHFPTAHALVEALVESDLDRYRELAAAASTHSDSWIALEALIRRGLRLQLEHGGLQEVLLAPADASADVAALKAQLVESTKRVLASAREAGAVRADLTVDALQHLVCGIEHGVRVGGDEEFLVSVALAGIRRP